MLHYMPQTYPLWIALTDYGRPSRADHEALTRLSATTFNGDWEPEETGLIIGWEINDDQPPSETVALYLRKQEGVTVNALGISDSWKTAAATGPDRASAKRALIDLLLAEKKRAQQLLTPEA